MERGRGGGKDTECRPGRPVKEANPALGKMSEGVYITGDVGPGHRAEDDFGAGEDGGASCSPRLAPRLVSAVGRGLVGGNLAAKGVKRLHSALEVVQ